MSDSRATIVSKIDKQIPSLARSFLLKLNQRSAEALASFLTRNGPDQIHKHIQLTAEEENILLAIPTLDRRAVVGIGFLAGLLAWGATEPLDNLAGNPLNPADVALVTNIGKAVTITTMSAHATSAVLDIPKGIPDHMFRDYCDTLSMKLADYKKQLKKSQHRQMVQ